MHRFYADPARSNDSEFFLSADDAHHAVNVLRLHPGDKTEIFFRGDRWLSELTSCGQDVILCPKVKLASTEPSLSVTLFQGLPKGDKMEWIVQKAVELGAFEIIPMATKRCVVKLDEKKSQSKIKIWQAIAEAAAKQSKRAIIPNVHMPMTMKEAVQYAKDMDVKLIPYENAEHMDVTKNLIEGIKPGESVAVFIGPEGGFSEEEIELCKASDIKPITLGKRILRTETAGFTIISWLMYHLEG